MGAVIRGHDWARSPLGVPDGWPAELKTAVALMLGATQPVYIAFGPELTSLYNDGYLPIVGTKHPAGFGAPFAELWVEIWDSFAPIVAATLAGEAQHFVDLPIELAGRPGTPVGYFTFSYTALRDAAGVATGFYCAATETTSQVLAERQLRALSTSLGEEIEERTHERDQLWSLSEDLLVLADYEGRLLRVSPSWVTMTGVDEAALLRDPYTELTHPADRVASMAKVGTMRATQTPVRFENRIRGTDGRWHVVAWTLSPEEGGERFTGIGRDLTAERAAEAALRDTEDFARLALTAVGGVGVWTYDVASDLFVCDAAISALYGLDPERGAAGVSREEFLANVIADDRASLASTMSGGLLRPGDLELEYRIRLADGTTRSVLSRGHTYFDEAGEPVRRTGIGIEMTRQRQLEDQLRQSQKMEALGQLTGGIAHDFNNLLTVIRGSADLLRRSDLSEERRHRYLDAVAGTADRASKLTGQLLAFLLRQALNPEIFDVGVAVAALRDIIDTLTGSQIAVEIVVEGRPCHVHADRSQFDTAIVNMAANARDAMNGQGVLTIRVDNADIRPAVRGHAAVAGPHVTVALTDTGSGIPAGQIEQIFEPFYTTKGVGEGTGLGLSQVFGFSKQSDGEIVVESVEGAGATFTLYLPSAAAGADGAVPATAPAIVGGAGTRVLVVEDNEGVGRFVTQALAELGYATELAVNGDEALAVLARAPASVDMVFTDVVMPGMSGIELGQAIRRDHPDVPVILTSGYSAVLAQHGSDGFELLRKPYSIEELAVALAKVADRRG